MKCRSIGQWQFFAKKHTPALVAVIQSSLAALMKDRNDLEVLGERDMSQSHDMVGSITKPSSFTHTIDNRASKPPSYLAQSLLQLHSTSDFQLFNAASSFSQTLLELDLAWNFNDCLTRSGTTKPECNGAISEGTVELVRRARQHAALDPFAFSTEAAPPAPPPSATSKTVAAAVAQYAHQEPAKATPKQLPAKVSKPCQDRVVILDVAAFGCGQVHSSPSCDEDNPRIWSKHHHFQHSSKRPAENFGAAEMQEDAFHHIPENLEWTGSAWEWAGSSKGPFTKTKWIGYSQPMPLNVSKGPPRRVPRSEWAFGPGVTQA